MVSVIQVFHTGFWLNTNHINYSSRINKFVLNANILCQNDQIIKYIALKMFWTAVLILFCLKSCLDVTLTLFVYWVFGPY